MLIEVVLCTNGPFTPHSDWFTLYQSTGNYIHSEANPTSTLICARTNTHTHVLYRGGRSGGGGRSQSLPGLHQGLYLNVRVTKCVWETKKKKSGLTLVYECLIKKVRSECGVWWRGLIVLLKEDFKETLVSRLRGIGAKEDEGGPGGRRGWTYCKWRRELRGSAVNRDDWRPLHSNELIR